MKTSNQLQYKGYSGNIVFSEEDGVFHGKVAGIKSLISFEGDSVDTITEDFQNAVDEYLDFCMENKVEPEKQFKGSFNIRIAPQLHRQLANYSSSNSKSLNSVVEEAIRSYINQSSSVI